MQKEAARVHGEESNGSSPETLKQAKDGTSLAVVQHLGSYLPV